MKNKIDASKIKVGDLMATICYEKVVSVGKDSIKVENLQTKDQYEIRGKPLLELMYSASQFNSTKTVGKFEMAELLIASANLPVCVNFDKIDGTNRTFYGRISHSEPLMGRIYADDFEDGFKQKQLDSRTTHWAIVNMVKYLVK